MPFFVLRARKEVAIASARARLAQVRAEGHTDDHLMAQRLRATAEETKQQALNELMRELRFEQSHYSAEGGAADPPVEIMLPFRRLFFRNLRLFSWIDRGTIVANGREIQQTGSLSLSQPAGGVCTIAPGAAVEPAVTQLVAHTGIASSRKLFLAGAVDESPIDSPTEGSQMFRFNPFSERTPANASPEDERVIPDPIASPIPEKQGTESNPKPVRTVLSAAEEFYYKSTFKLATTADDQSPTDYFKEGTQMLKPMTQAPPAQNPSSPAEDQRMTRQLTSMANTWNAKEPAQESIPSALASVDEIYHKSNFKPTTTTAEWHILKVADMLNSEHLRGLSAAAKHSALLMALEAAGVSVEDVLQDAVLRQRVLNEYEQAQQARLQQMESLKLRESERLTAEMEAIRSQYEARIAVVVEGLEREREAVREWQANKEVEQRRIAEAAASVSYASNENNVKYLVEKNGSSQRMRESA